MVGGDGAIQLLPRDGGTEELHRDLQSTMLESVELRSKIESVEPKIDLCEGLVAGQSRRR